MTDFRPPAFADEGSMKSWGEYPPAYIVGRLLLTRYGWADFILSVRKSMPEALLSVFYIFQAFITHPYKFMLKSITILLFVIAL